MKTRILIAATGLIAVGCGSARDGGVTDEVKTTDSQSAPLYTGFRNNPNGTFWKTGLPAQAAYVPVCFTRNASQDKGKDGASLLGVPGYPGFANLKAWIREAVENSWGRAANITFEGWNNICNSPQTDDDNNRTSNPHTVMFMFKAASDSDSRWSTDCQGNNPDSATPIRVSPLTQTRQAVQYPAIHEMGHALGLDHEQQRPDNWDSSGNPKTCLNHNPGEGADPGGIYETSFIDNQSIMCYDVTPSKLSPGDVMGIQALYGPHGPGSIVGYGAKCAYLSSTNDGTPILAEDCIYQSLWGMNWLSYFNQLTATPDGGTTTKSWNVSGGTVSTTAPTPLIGWVYGNFNNQIFKLNNMLWKGLGDMCVVTDSATVNAQLKIQPCGTPGKKERWNFWDNSTRIQLTGTNLCAAEPRSPAVNNDVLTLQTCANVNTQNFDFSSQHEMKDAASGRCANVLGGKPTAGSLVGMWSSCPNFPQNELFHMTGHIVSAVLPGASTGQCAAWRGNSTDFDTPAQVHVCDAAPAPINGWTPPDPQDFDLYWP